MGDHAREFFDAEQEARIIAAIQHAEQHTSGEIRVHVEDATDKDALERAKEVFERLEMHKTELRNGVLFYLAVDQHHFAIYGDAGINMVVPDHFWEDTRDIVLTHFRKGDFATGLEHGIKKAGYELKVHFPFSEDDINELPDDISKGPI